MKFSLNLRELNISFPYKQKEVEQTRTFSDILPLLTIVLSVISFLAWYFYFKQGLTLSYNDARSHLNVARRVFDSLQPGFVQIGSVWLPFYHILELPFVWNDYLWRTGLAGSIVSMISFVLGGVYIVKLARELKFDFYASLLSLLVYSLNPNMVFMQAIPMTESLLIFLSIASVYYIIRWLKYFQVTDLVMVSLFTYLATLTRYDGWFLLLSMIAVIFFTSFKKRDYKFAEGAIVLFLTLAAFGVLLWFLWNLLIFGDPFYFVFGPFSAKAQQDVLVAEGRLLTKGNLVYSIFIYLLAVIYNLGFWVFLLSIVALFYFFYNQKTNWNIKLAVSVLAVPFFFNVLSLWAGHSVIHLPKIPPYTWFNDRYGLMVLPFASIILGYFVIGKKLAFWLVVSLIFVQTLTMYISNEIITIQDGVRGASGTYLDDASNWISENVDDGLVLVAASANDALLFKSGLKLRQFITEGARKHWDVSMKDPTVYAKWIVMHKGDLVEKNLRNNEIFLNNYRLVYKDSFTYIYKLDKGRSSVLTNEELPL